MVRYVDVNKVYDEAKNGYHSDFARCSADLTSLREVLEDTPTADVEVVKRGQWIGIDGDQCSECNKYLSEIMDADSYYAIGFDINKIVACPFCGAKMGGERSVE